MVVVVAGMDSGFTRVFCQARSAEVNHDLPLSAATPMSPRSSVQSVRVTGRPSCVLHLQSDILSVSALACAQVFNIPQK